jgi:hypothetical protein
VAPVSNSQCAESACTKSAGTCFRFQWSVRRREDSHEEGLQLDLEGGNGIERLLVEGLMKVRKGECFGTVRLDHRRAAQWDQCRADRGLSSDISLPNPIGSRIAQGAIELSKCCQFVAGTDNKLKKHPQAFSAQKQSADLIGHVEAEGPSAAACPISVTAEDACSANGCLQLVFLVIATQESVLDQASHLIAMGTGGDFEPDVEFIEFLPRRIDPALDGSLPIVRSRCHNKHKANVSLGSLPAARPSLASHRETKARYLAGYNV